MMGDWAKHGASEGIGCFFILLGIAAVLLAFGHIGCVEACTPS
jgi:hypothetical protein